MARVAPTMMMRRRIIPKEIMAILFLCQFLLNQPISDIFPSTNCLSLIISGWLGRKTRALLIRSLAKNNSLFHVASKADVYFSLNLLGVLYFTPASLINSFAVS